MPRRLLKGLKHRFREPIHRLERRVQASRHGRNLVAVQDHSRHIGRDDVLLFATLRNEAVRIPYFLDYYRGLGVHHFLFVDNGSSDGFQDLVRGARDVSVWRTESSYRDANFGMHWLNALLGRYGCEHWCVTCDLDELLVYPHWEERNLSELGAFLEDERRRSLCCLMLDLYPRGPVERAMYRAGQNPLDVADGFDPNGYTQAPGPLQDVVTRGGVRRRVFFRDIPDQSPALHKTPFVKWHASYHYFLSMHQLVPGWLNRPHQERRNSTTGCLLHFKYLNLLKSRVAEEMERGEHWNAGFEYHRYHDTLQAGDVDLSFPGTVRYQGWRQLVDLGLMNMGTWF